MKDNLESRSGALKLLVEAEWDRFVGVKGTTESKHHFTHFHSLVMGEMLIGAMRGCYIAVFEEMKHGGGPLEEGTDYGVKSIRETLKRK